MWSSIAPLVVQDVAIRLFASVQFVVQEVASSYSPQCCCIGRGASVVLEATFWAPRLHECRSHLFVSVSAKALCGCTIGASLFSCSSLLLFRPRYCAVARSAAFIFQVVRLHDHRFFGSLRQVNQLSRPVDHLLDTLYSDLMRSSVVFGSRRGPLCGLDVVTHGAFTWLGSPRRLRLLHDLG